MRGIWIVIAVIISLGLIGCSRSNDSQAVKGNFEDNSFFKGIKVSSEYFDLSVGSQSEFIENEPLKFKTVLKYTGVKSAKFEGGERKVRLDIKDSDGNLVDQVFYHDLAITKEILTSEEFIEYREFKGLKSGTYYLTVQSSWLKINGIYQEGVGYENHIKRYEERNGNLTDDLRDLLKSKIIIEDYQIEIKE